MNIFYKIKIEMDNRKKKPISALSYEFKTNSNYKRKIYKRIIFYDRNFKLK